MNFLLRCYNFICKKFPWFNNLFLYAIIGLAAAVLDYSIFFIFCKSGLTTPETASLIGNICGFGFTFSGNTFYNFKKSDHAIFRFTSYLCIALFGMAFSTTAIHIAKNYMDVYLLKAVLMLFVIPLMQFILNKKITYREFKKAE